MGRTKVFGGAGCGKTHYLMDQLSTLLKSGTCIEDVCMLTMTRNGAKEFQERAKDVGGVSNLNDIKWFGTMHSRMWKLLELNKHNIAKADLMKPFYEGVGLTHQPDLLQKLEELNSYRRNCMQPCDKAGVLATQALTGYNVMYTDKSCGSRHVASFNKLIEFGKALDEFMINLDVYDYTRIIEVALEYVSSGEVEIPFSKLFADEFQDFSPLQHALYRAMSDRVDDDWVCGDDLQVIFRYSGATPSYLINDVCDEEIILPKTYRYGYEILQNANRYVAGISVKKDRIIEPCDKPSSVLYLSGDSWTSHLHEHAGMTAYLVRTGNAITQVCTALDRAGIIYGYLGQSKSKVESIISCYNTIATLQRGDMTPSDTVRELLSKMTAMIPSGQKGVDGVERREQFLKPGLKAEVNEKNTDHYWFFETYPLEWYTIETFAETFLKSEKWDLLRTASAVPDLLKFVSDKGIQFPNPIDEMIMDWVGTIHKFKGNEAENVFLFTQVPYIVSDGMIKSVDKRDDELRTFYVGATRPKDHLYEVNNYLVDRFGNLQRNMSDMM